MNFNEYSFRHNADNPNDKEMGGNRRKYSPLFVDMI